MRILVTAASKHGATDEMAKAIGDALTGAGAETVVSEPDTVSSLAGYDAVIIGSGVYAGQWLGPAKKLIEREGAALRGLPVWFFSSGPAGDPLKPEGEPTGVLPLIQAIQPREHRVFGGRIDRKRLSFAEKAIVAVVKAPDGDFRPWDDLRAWATGIARELGA